MFVAKVDLPTPPLALEIAIVNFVPRIGFFTKVFPPIFFTQIPEVVALVLKEMTPIEPNTLNAVQVCDRNSRELTQKLITKYFIR